MRQFKTWNNNLEADPTKLAEEKQEIQRIEFRQKDRVEKTINVQAYVNPQRVTKGYYERKKWEEFGIGESWEDRKTNAAVCTVQRENVWAPYYEVNIEEMDFKEKMIQAAQKNAIQNIGGTKIKMLEEQLGDHDRGVQQANADGANLGPKKFNLKEKMALLAARDREEGDKPVIDPYTVKIRKFGNEMTEQDLEGIMSKFGPIRRVKIPMDEFQQNKGIGFVTFATTEACTQAAEDGFIKYDFYELPIERATQSKAEMERRTTRGGMRGGGGDRRGGFGGDRPYGDRDRDGGGDRGGRGGYGDRGDRRRDDGGDTGFIQRRT